MRSSEWLSGIFYFARPIYTITLSLSWTVAQLNKVVILRPDLMQPDDKPAAIIRSQFWSNNLSRSICKSPRPLTNMPFNRWSMIKSKTCSFLFHNNKTWFPFFLFLFTIVKLSPLEKKTNHQKEIADPALRWNLAQKLHWLFIVSIWAIAKKSSHSVKLCAKQVHSTPNNDHVDAFFSGIY